MRVRKANSLQYDANTHAWSNLLSNVAAAVCGDLYSSSSDDEEILLLLLRRRRKRSIAANRMIWTKRWILRRRTKGACANIVRELNIEDPEKFRQYHRLDRASFEEILTRRHFGLKDACSTHAYSHHIVSFNYYGTVNSGGE